jgi:hypothetical protein
MNSMTLAVIAEEFAPGTPAQQLLDRFLLGYPRDGEFYRAAEELSIRLYITGGRGNPDVARRVQDHGLVWTDELEHAVTLATAMILVPRSVGAETNNEFIRKTLAAAKTPARCFVHGTLGDSLTAAQAHARLAQAGRVPLLTGSAVGVTWHLPELEIPQDTRFEQALIITQGASPGAEFDGLDGLLPILARRRGGETGMRSVQFFEGAGLWQASKDGLWRESLLAAAISRSDSPQGDPVKDGRTQDLVGLGLVPKLARNPRGWILEHRDGLRSIILVLDGVIADYNFAVQTIDGTLFSAQIFRPPKPRQDQYSRLAVVLEDFFRAGTPPWPIERGLLTAGLLEAMAKAAAQPSTRIETPELTTSLSIGH